MNRRAFLALPAIAAAGALTREQFVYAVTIRPPSYSITPREIAAFSEMLAGQFADAYKRKPHPFADYWSDAGAEAGWPEHRGPLVKP